MDLEVQVPLSDAIPVHWEWFQGLLTVTFICHLLFISTALGLMIIASVNSLTKANGTATAISRDAAYRLPFIIAFAINLGVPPLLFFSVIWGHVGYVSTVLMAAWWVSVVALLIIAYYGAYVFKFRFDALGKAKAALIVGTTLIFLFVAFLFSNNFTLAQRMDAWVEYFDSPAGGLLNLSDPTLWPRYLHFIVASIAQGGLFVALVWSGKKKQGEADALQKVTFGLRWFFWATIAQVIVGSWFLASQPGHIIKLFMGKDLLATALMLCVVFLVPLMLVLAKKQKVIATTVVLVSVVSVMAVCRELLRRGALGDAVLPDKLSVTGEYSPMVFFAVSFVVGAVVIIYLLRLLNKAATDGGEQ